MLFGEHLRTARKKKELSAEELAKACGIARSYITLIENGKRLPSKKVIPKLSLALDVKRHIVINWYLEEVREKLQ